jgi:hypothetical protein
VKRMLLMLALLQVTWLGTGRAGVVVGDTAPAFTKNELDAPAPAARSLASYPGKVIVFFLLGYN